MCIESALAPPILLAPKPYGSATPTTMPTTPRLRSRPLPQVYPVFDSRIVSLAMILCAGVVSSPAIADKPSASQATDAEATNTDVEATNTDAAGESNVADQWASVGWPLLQAYCLDCHNNDTREGELNLAGFETLASLEGDVGEGGANSMHRVLEMVRFGAMPPEDSDQPTPEERKRLVLSLDRTMFAVSCDLTPKPGKVTARRLNRAEYNHSIRDLFGIDLRPADVFPSDEVGAGFDNNGDVLSLSPMLMEKYIAAAEGVSTKVLIDPTTLPRIDDQRPSDQLLIHGDTKTGRFNGRFLKTSAFAWADFEIPVDGEYRVRIAGGNSRRERPPTTVAVFDESGLLRGKGELNYYGGSGGSDRFEFRAKFEKGRQRFYVEPIEKREELEVDKTVSTTFAKLPPKLIARAVERQQQPLKPERNFDESEYPFMIRHIEVSGPTEQPRELFPPSQFQILRRTAKLRDDRWHDVEQAARECLRPLMHRAFREPVSDEEVEPYARLVSTATNRGDSYYRGLQIAISAVLMSPRFLFRVETPPEDWTQDNQQDDGSVRLTPHQLATRLSYFLWSSTPDGRLLDDADHNKLDEARLESHVQRMLDDEKADALAEQFASQWLGLRNLEEHEADTDKFATFTPSLRNAMARETELVFMDVVRNNRPVVELLTSDFTFVNGELASHYGIKGIDGEAFQRVSLVGTPRRGVLSHASVLTLTSNPARTSPVQRGKWILENVLGTPPPDPPAGVPELEETKTAAAGASLREQLEIHRADPSCAACHRVMDQLGFGLEQFDAIGRFRDKQGDFAIDASGELPGGRVFNGATELTQMLGKTESAAFAQTVVRRLMTFALGRELTPADRCTVDEIVASTADREHRFVDLVMEVVKSRPFQFYDWVEPNGESKPEQEPEPGDADSASTKASL